MKIFSPAIKAASGFALGGAAFALANLVLARNLSTQDYGQFALILAIFNFGIPLGPLGLNAAVLRHRPGPNNRLLRVSIVVGVLTGAFIAITAKYAYSLDVSVIFVLGIAIMVGSFTVLSASVYQSENRFSTSLWMIQSPNITLIVAALAAGLIVSITPETVFALFTVHWAAVALLGWVSLIHFSNIKKIDDWKIPWKEMPALFGFIVTVQLAAQFDKLMLPKVLGIESLATFGVLSSLVISPYKMFQAGVGYTLIPGLRTAKNKSERTQTILHEARTTLLVLAFGVVSGFFIAPWVAKTFLAGKYELDNLLIGAAVFAGTVRVLMMFVSSIVTALGSQNQLTLLTRGSWVALLVSVAVGWWGSQWGLPGFIAGFAVGGLVRVALVSIIAAKVWREPTLSHS